jgi:hypothetical protein
MKALVIVVPLVLALSIIFIAVVLWPTLTPNAGQTSTACPSVVATPVTGTVTAMITRPMGTALVVWSGTTLKEIWIPRSCSVITRDGFPLAAAHVLVGDLLALRADGTIQDISQAGATVTGRVVDAPDPLGSPMVVQISRSQSIVVDLEPGTHITDLQRNTLSIADVRDVDQVRITGILDQVLDEMTQTKDVVRLS